MEEKKTWVDWTFWALDSAAFKWVVLIFVLVMPLASLLTWAERRQSAMMQDRLGPNRANIGPIKLWGILHFVADALKMISKEDFVPEKAHRILFSLAPILALAPVLVAFAIIPFGPTIFPHELHHVIDVRVPHDTSHAVSMQVYSAEFGLLFYFAILTLANYGATIAGWASYNKFALLGGLRASSQMMSYEVAMGLALLGVFLVTGTLEPYAMVEWQRQNVWGIVAQPVAFLLFLTAAIAETKRAPFDLPEGEPEIVGYFVEYSGLRFGMFFLGGFIEVVFASAVIVTVFFGGWHVPYLDLSTLPSWAALMIGLGAWGFKVVFFCWFQLLIRWTLPRFRPDQLMGLGWKKLLPLSLANMLVTALYLLLTK